MFGNGRWRDASAVAGGVGLLLAGVLLLPGPDPAGDVGVVPGGLAAAGPAGGARHPGVPVRLEVHRLGLAAPVVPVRVEDDGELGVPDDPRAVGWWDGGARPGSGQGSVVIDGHVDSAELGPGAFWRLRELRPGDSVVVETGAGATLRYVVTGRREYAKSELPAATLFSPGGAERLVLVTCSGGFDRDARSYTHNVVVFALPA